MAGLLSYVIRRLLFVIPVFIAVSILTFIIANAAGSPIDIIRHAIQRITPSQLAALQSFYHLNQPITVRYFIWLNDFLHGNLGQSLYGGSVSAQMLPWVSTTLELQLVSLALSLGIGIPIGLYSAKHQYSKTDVAVTTASIFGYSTPVFLIGIFLIIVFSIDLHWLPGNGAVSPYAPYWWGSVFADQVAHIILPATALTLVSIAVYVRLIRANVLEVLRQDYILAARASGLREWSITYKHALKNAITPVVTVVGLTVASFLAGAPATETTFGWPGLGFRFVTAALNLDLPVVQGITMVITIVALVFILVTDLAYAFLDPRVRLS
ncbi:MAG TPA: ABC transporter permease [Nitrososphaerales archaeon]|nr:ABC transporter permease [Nitrososphaerales archaeon]